VPSPGRLRGQAFNDHVEASRGQGNILQHICMQFVEVFVAFPFHSFLASATSTGSFTGSRKAIRCWKDCRPTLYSA